MFWCEYSSVLRLVDLKGAAFKAKGGEHAYQDV